MIKYKKLNIIGFPKCGVSFIHNLIKYNKDVLDNLENEIYIIIVRDPKNRMVSFYCDKILNLSYDSIGKKNQGNQYEAQCCCVYNFINGKETMRYVNGSIDLRNSSFEFFINQLYKNKDINLEPHLLSMSKHLNKIINDNNELRSKNIDLIISINDRDFNKKILELFNKNGCNIDLNFIKNNYNSNKTIRNNDINYYIGNKCVKDLRDIGGIPKDNNYFFNKETLEKIKEIYKNDYNNFNKYF